MLPDATPPGPASLMMLLASFGSLFTATAGHHPTDIDACRARAPWYASKAQPSTADMLAKPGDHL